MKSVNDFRQHYYISKLDRGEVEDKYHRLLESNIELKKKYNSLEEKLKFYFVKFGHLPSNNEKSSLISVNQQNVESEPFLKRQQARVDELEQINATLRNDMHVLKDQLAMHSRLHAKSHCHTSWQPARCYCQPESPKKASMKHEMFPNSHRTVHQFQSSNAKKKKVTSGESQSSQSNTSLQEKQQMNEEISKLRDQNVILNQEMEVIRKEKNARIAELEEELSNVVTKDKSQKVAENVEVIRLKLLNQKLVAQQSALEAQTQTLEKTLGDVQEAMNTLQNENEQLQQQLVEERQKISDLLQQVQEVSDLRQALQEMVEEVQDSKREKGVLKEHNDWLLVLTESAQLRDKDDRERTMEAEKELRTQITTLEEKLTVELKERAELLGVLEETRKQVAILVNSKETGAKVVKQDATGEESKVDGADRCQGGCSHMQHEVSQLREMLAHELGERATIVKTLEEERVQVVALRTDHVQLVKQLEQVYTKCNKMESNLEKMANEPVDVNKELGGVNQSLVPSQDVISANTNKNLKPTLQLEATSRETNIHLSGNVRTPTLNQTLQVATSGFGYQPAQVLEDHQQSLTSEVPDSESSVDTCQVYVPPTEVETSMISVASLDESELLHDPISGSMDDKIRALYKTTMSIQNISGGQEELDSQSESYPSLTVQSKGSLIMNQTQTFLRDSAPASRNVKPRDEANAADNVQLADYIDTIRELDKCRELLRVQCNLNGVYKQELSSLKQYYSPREEGEINTNSSEDVKLTNEKDVDLITMKHNSHNTNRLTILDEGQGLFEIHIQHLKLANEALSKLGSSNPSLFVSWEFYNLSAVYTPLRTGPNARFEFSSVYLVDINNDFIEYLAEETCVVSVHIANGDEGVQIAQGQLQFAPLLEFPHNKLQNSIQLQGLGSDHTNTVFGTLYFWFRLSCSDQLVDKLRKGTHKTSSKVPASPRDMPIPAPRHPPGTAKEKNAVADAKSLLNPRSSRNELNGNSLSNMEDKLMLQPANQASGGSQKEQDLNKVTELGQKEDLALEQGQRGQSPIKQYPSKIASSNDAKNDSELTVKSAQQMDGASLLKIPELSDSEDEDANTYTVRHGNKDDSSSSIDSGQVDVELGVTGLQRAGTGILKSSELTNSEDEDTNTYTVRQEAGGDISSSNSDDVVIGTKKNEETNLLKHSSSHPKGNAEDLAKDPHWERHPVALDEIEIEIHSLKLNEKSSTMSNADIVQLYVEFAFLGHRGQDMETVSSRKLNSNPLLQYNFKKVFHVDADSHSTERQMLAQMLNLSGSDTFEKSGVLHFVVVSEPLEADAEVKDCEEVGFVDVDLLQVLKKGKNLHKVEFPIMSSHGNEVLGSLTLSLTGVQVMKAVAAHSKQPAN